MALTYKTVITNAIKGFNDIQSKLATLTDLGISAVSSSTTSGVTTVSNSITPADMIDAIGKLASIKKSDGSFISGKVTYRGSANATVNPTISRSENIVTVTFSKSLAGAGYYTGGTISNGTSNTLTIPAGSITATPSVSQKTYDGTSTTALSTDILKTTAPSSYYKITMDPSVSISIGTDGYHSASVGTRTAASGTTLTRYIQKGSVTSSISGTNPTVTPSTSISGTIANYGITTTKPTSGTDGTNYLTITPGGSSNSQTFTAGMTFTAGYIASKGTEGTKSVSATVSTSGTKHYIPIVTPAFDGGSVTATATGLSITDTDTDPGTGIKIVPARAAVLYNGAVKGLVNVADNTTARASGSNTYYVTKVSLPAGKTLGHYTSSTDYEDGIEVNGASGSIGTLYAGFSTSGYGDLYLRDAGATSYKKVATSGKLVTASPSFDGGTLSGGGLSVSDTNLDLSTTDNGISFTVTRAAVDRAAVLYNGSVDGWVNKSDNSSALEASTAALASVDLKRYITGVTVPKNKTFSVTMTADTELDTSSNLTITNAAYRNVSITNSANGTITINGGNKDKGVLINGVNGKTATVDGTVVTDTNGDLKTTTVTGTPSVSASGLGTTTTNTGVTITGGGSASTGTGWISNGSWSNTTSKYVNTLTIPASKTFSSVTLTSGTSDNRTYLTNLTVNGYTTISTLTLTGIISTLTNSSGIIENMGGANNRITNMSGTTTITNLGTSASSATLTLSNNTYGTVNIWGASGDKTVQVSNHTVTVDGTTVTNSSGDLTTTSRSAGAGSITLTAGAGSVTASSYVTLGTTDNGISVSGSGTVSGKGKGTVSTGNGWITSGSTTSNEAEDSKTSDIATKWITAIKVPKDKPFTVTMDADTAEDNTSTLSVTTAAYRKMSINGGGDKGVTLSGANGKTATVDGTTVTNASGDLTTTSMSSSVSGATVTVSTGTGWITSGTVTKTVSSGTLSTSDATTNNAVPSGYTENTSIVVPTKGWLLIGDGYYPKTAISLDTILGGKDDGTTTAINAGYIRSGYKAYNIDGELITGSMADWSPSSSYYTTTNTGFGVATGGQYITATRYIKAAAGWSSTGSVTTAPSVTISKLINSNITTHTTDTYGTGFLITDSVSESNGTVQTKYSISTAGWTATKSNVNSGTVDVDPSVTNSFGDNYITKLTIPAGKTFGSYAEDGVTINGSSGSIGALYAGFSTNEYGDLYLRNGGATSYTKVATAGKLVTTSLTFSGGGLSGGGLSVSDSNMDLSTTNNGISFTVTRADIERAAITYTNTAGWLSAHSGTTAVESGSLTSNVTLTRYVTGITVPKDKTFSLTTTADTTLDTTSNVSVTNGAFRNLVVTNSANGTLTINGGNKDKGVLINGANGKTATVDGTTVTNASGDLITASPSFAGGSVSGSTSVTASSSQLTLSDTDTDPGSGILITAAASGTASRTAVTYTNTAGWLSAHSGTTASAAISNQAITGSSNKYYVTEVSISSGKTLSKVTNAGTITTLTGTGTIGTQSGTQTVTSNTGTITNTTNNGTVTVTTNAASKNVNIGTNNGNINITNASTGTVNYEDWKIYYNNSNKTIEFLFTE